MNICRTCWKPEEKDKKWKWRDVENPNHRAMHHGLLDAEPDHVSSSLSKTSHHNQLSFGEFSMKLNFDKLWAYYYFLVWDCISFYILNMNPHIPEIIWKGFVIFEPFSDLKKAFHIKSVDILEIIWKGFVNWFLLSSL